MPLDALNIDNRGKYVHSPAHDLEALLQTVLGLAMFTTGPYQARTQTTLHVPMSRWYNEGDRDQLFKDKAFDLFSFDRDVAAYFPQYWKPLIPFFRRLVSATWTSMHGTSHATHAVYRTILLEARDALRQYPELPAKYACCALQKRPRPSDINETGRYPYKYLQGNGPDVARIPRPIGVKELSQWEDSVDA